VKGRLFRVDLVLDDMLAFMPMASDQALEVQGTMIEHSGLHENSNSYSGWSRYSGSLDVAPQAAHKGALGYRGVIPSQ
jgi:hypothetical protein